MHAVCTSLTLLNHCEERLWGHSMASSFRTRGFLLIALAAVLGSFGTVSPPAAAADIVVNPNEDLLVKLPPRVTTIVVGNPLMVDVSLAARGFMVITAKSYGETNLIFLDRAGTVLMEPTVLVREKNDDERVIYKGVKREDDASPVTEPNAAVLHFNGVKRANLPVGN